MISQSKDTNGIPTLDKATVISLDGGASWISPNYPGSLQITPQEGSKIAQVMKSGDFSPFQANGVVIEGVKYQFLREDGRVAFAKAKGKGSLALQKSKSAVVIGHTIEGRQQGFSNKAVGIIADYLESVGR